MKKSQLYQGSFAPTMLELTDGLSLQIWTIVPAVNFDTVATNGYAWFVVKGPPDWSNTNNPGGPLCYRKLQWQGTNAMWADTNWTVLSNTVPTYQNYYDLDGTNITVDSTGGPVFAPDPGSASAFSLNIIGSRLTPTVIRDDFLWTCQAVGLKGTNGTYVGGSSYTNVDRSGIQWLRFQVDANGGTLTFTNNGRIYDPAATNAMYYYVPSLMVNGNGDMLMGFSGSSVSNYISAYYSWRLGSGSMLAQPNLIQSGTVKYSNQQWGDYSATTLDPTDGVSIWSVQAYTEGSPTRSAAWATVVGKILPHP